MTHSSINIEDALTTKKTSMCAKDVATMDGFLSKTLMAMTFCMVMPKTLHQIKINADFRDSAHRSYNRTQIIPHNDPIQ